MLINYDKYVIKNLSRKNQVYYRRSIYKTPKHLDYSELIFTQNLLTKDIKMPRGKAWVWEIKDLIEKEGGAQKV